MKNDVIPNGFEKYMVFMINQNFINSIKVFIDSMQFMNSSLEKLVTSFAGNDFNYLI